MSLFPSKPGWLALHLRGSGLAVCGSLRTGLCSNLAPNEKELIVLIGLSVNPVLCPLGKSANAQGSSCPLSSPSSLIPLNLPQHWNQMIYFKCKSNQPLPLFYCLSIPLALSSSSQAWTVASNSGTQSLVGLQPEVFALTNARVLATQVYFLRRLSECFSHSYCSWSFKS